ncbi:MAG: glycosyltransferase family 2 protein [Aquiluna sp.]|nr:glycosyltransferase family 2 protein [Aquiluna sp.]MCF8545827.1 glycosyltransferase family 2 protein [Aquiluna sp.]
MPVLNEATYLEGAVASVFEQSVPGEMELVLSLGPSTDGTDLIAKQLKKKYGTKLQLVHNPKGKTATALNLAIAKSKFEVIARVDAHSELSFGYAQLAVKTLNSSGAANVGGMMIAKGKTDFQKAVAYGYNNRVGLGGGSFHVGGNAGPADTVYLGVFRKSVLEELGGFSEVWIRGQDWELNKRIREAGHVVWFEPDLKVGYYPRSSWEALAKQFFKTGMWRGALTREAPGQSAVRYWIPPVLVLATLFWFPLWIYLLGIAGLVALSKGTSNAVKLWLMLVLPTMHYAWGIGFWFGLIRDQKRA